MNVYIYIYITQYYICDLISHQPQQQANDIHDGLKPPRMPKAISSCAASRRRRAKSSLKSLDVRDKIVCTGTICFKKYDV